MKMMQAAPMAGLVAAANAWGTTAGSVGTAYTTLLTTQYVTYCPEPTTFAYKNVTYTVTKPTTLTITNCPCTISVSQPPPVTTTSYCPPTSYPVGTGKPPGPTYSPPVPTYGNSSIVIPPPATVVPPPPAPTTGYYTTITYLPPPVTYLPGTTAVPGTPGAPGAPGTPTTPGAPGAPGAPSGAPTKTPIAPTTTGSIPIPTAGAAKAGTVGALLAVAGLAIAM